MAVVSQAICFSKWLKSLAGNRRLCIVWACQNNGNTLVFAAFQGSKSPTLDIVRKGT